MEIKEKAVAGTLESSDMFVMIEPNSEGIELELESVVMGQYGENIKSIIFSTLEELDVKAAKLLINDKGAIDAVIKSRIQTAVLRASKEKYNWK